LETGHPAHAANALPLAVDSWALDHRWWLRLMLIPLAVDSWALGHRWWLRLLLIPLAVDSWALGHRWWLRLMLISDQIVCCFFPIVSGLNKEFIFMQRNLKL